MRTACLVNFEKNINSLWRTKYTAECAILHRYLDEHKINCYFYSEKDITSTIDIAENIVAISDEICILITRNENLNLNLSFAKAIRSEEPDCLVVFYITEVLTMDNENKISGEYSSVYMTNSVAINEILDIEDEENDSFLTDYCQFLDDNDIHKFNGEVEILLGCKDRNQVIVRNSTAVTKDINVVCKSNLNTKCIKLSGIGLDEYDDIKNIFDTIRDNGEGITFIAEVKLSYIIENLPENMLLTLVVEDQNDVDAYEKVMKLYSDKVTCLKMHSILLESDNKIKDIFTHAIEHNMDVQTVCNDNRYWKELDIEEIQPESISKKIDSEFKTFMNGLIFSYTGEYISVPLNGFVKHVKLKSNELSGNLLEFLDEVCSINSSILIDDVVQVEDSKLMHFDNMTRIYNKNSLIENIKNQCEQGEYFPKNLIQIQNNAVNINGLVNGVEIKFTNIPYAEFDSKNFDLKDYHNILVFTLQDKKDLDKFIAEVDEFYSSRCLSKSTLLYGRMKNVCRFLSRNYCTLTKIPRIEIEKDGMVYPCYEKGEAIGNIEDSLFDITQSAYVKHENVMRENKCSKCPANIGCPKCAIMPDFIKEQYCTLMVHKPYISDFILESIVLVGMIHTNLQMSEISVDRIKLSNEYMDNMLSDYENGSEAPFFCKYVFIIEADPFFAIWSPNSNKTFKISKEIAIIGEALLKKINPKEIVTIMEDITKMSKEHTIQLCKKTFDLFYNSGLLHRPVHLEE